MEQEKKKIAIGGGLGGGSAKENGARQMTREPGGGEWQITNSGLGNVGGEWREGESRGCTSEEGKNVGYMKGGCRKSETKPYH